MGQALVARRTVRLVLGTAAVALAFAASGCAIFGGGGDKAPPAPEPVVLTLAGVDNLNSCGEGVGNALGVRIYQLTGDGRISISTLASLWSNDTAELGDELVDKTELILEPGDKTPVTLNIKPTANVVAVVGNYCKSDGDCWRWFTPASEMKGKSQLTFGEYCIEEAKTQ